MFSRKGFRLLSMKWPLSINHDMTHVNDLSPGCSKADVERAMNAIAHALEHNAFVKREVTAKVSYRHTPFDGRKEKDYFTFYSRTQYIDDILLIENSNIRPFMNRPHALKQLQEKLMAHGFKGTIDSYTHYGNSRHEFLGISNFNETTLPNLKETIENYFENSNSKIDEVEPSSPGPRY